MVHSSTSWQSVNLICNIDSSLLIQLTVHFSVIWYHLLIQCAKTVPSHSLATDLIDYPKVKSIHKESLFHRFICCISKSFWPTGSDLRSVLTLFLVWKAVIFSTTIRQCSKSSIAEKRQSGGFDPRSHNMVRDTDRWGIFRLIVPNKDGKMCVVTWLDLCFDKMASNFSAPCATWSSEP